MVPSISEAKDTIEEKPPEEKKEKADAKADSAATATEPAKKKKKKKKEGNTASSSSPASASASANGSSKDKESVADAKKEKEPEEKKQKPAEKKKQKPAKDAGDKAPEEDAKAKPEASSETGKPAEKEAEPAKPKPQSNDPSEGPVVSVSKRTRPPYKYDPEKVTLRFLFANKDGLTVTVECTPNDTVGEVKARLLSVWPEDLPSCSGGDQLRLICMGKGVLMPDSRTLRACEVPVFKTHPTPVNVAVRPKTAIPVHKPSRGKDGGSRGVASQGSPSVNVAEQSGQGCGCVIS